MSQKIPVTVVTGFLGAGKTTLLKGLLQQKLSRRFAVVINELGEVSIDGALIAGRTTSEGLEVHEISGGLVAYSGEDRFVPVMQEIAGRRHLFDHVLIETSGLALPTAAMEALQKDALRDDFILDATFAVVDTPRFLEGEFDGNGDAQSAMPISSLFEAQMQTADVVVLNKIDSMTEDELLVAESGIRNRAPAVRFVEPAHHAELDARLFLGLRLHQVPEHTMACHHGPSPDASSMQERLNGHSHSGLSPHEHGLSTHTHFHEQDAGWLAFVLKSHAPQRAEALERAVVAIAETQPLLRTKGFAHSTEGGTLLVQAVRTRVEVTPSDGSTDPHVELQEHAHIGEDGHIYWHAHDHDQHEQGRHDGRGRGDRFAGQAQLVFIGYHLDKASVAQMISELTNTQWQ